MPVFGLRQANRYMRIAQVAPLAESVPPKLYGGTERVVAWLIDELVELGHDVTLFASGDSVTRAKLVPAWPRALRLGRPATDPMAAQAALLEAVARHAHEFDVIHAHIDWVHLPLLSRLGVPFVTTSHGRLDYQAFRTLFAAFPQLPSFRYPITNVCRCPKRTGSGRSTTAFPPMRCGRPLNLELISRFSAG